MIQKGESADNTPNALPAPKTVFSKSRELIAPATRISNQIEMNKRLKMCGLDLLSQLDTGSIPVVFFDPQYRGVLDKMAYGNEGVKRGKKRSALPQMPEATIERFIEKISDVLMPSGHLFLWMDKYHLCEGVGRWIKGDLKVVDMITWHKDRMGMGYRSRRTCEYLFVCQKEPTRAKGVWQIHNIPDVWTEKIQTKDHTHRKPIKLQSALIEAVSNEGDIVVDPAAGSFSVLEAAQNTKRRFIGCDIR